ncbi:MAG: hypothetical protein RR400_03105 [Clostridia bacterium]
MKKEIYDQVGETSVLLNEKLNELKLCQEEKEELLKKVKELTKQGPNEQNAEILHDAMNANLERFEKVVREIEQIEKRLNS